MSARRGGVGRGQMRVEPCRQQQVGGVSLNWTTRPWFSSRGDERERGGGEGGSVLFLHSTRDNGRTCSCFVTLPLSCWGVCRARAFAKKLNDAPLAIVDKRRSAHNESEVRRAGHASRGGRGSGCLVGQRVVRLLSPFRRVLVLL